VLIALARVHAARRQASHGTGARSPDDPQTVVFAQGARRPAAPFPSGDVMFRTTMLAIDSAFIAHYSSDFYRLSVYVVGLKNISEGIEKI
jgi:hypothetical protein